MACTQETRVRIPHCPPIFMTTPREGGVYRNGDDLEIYHNGEFYRIVGLPQGYVLSHASPIEFEFDSEKKEVRAIFTPTS